MIFVPRIAEPAILAKHSLHWANAYLGVIKQLAISPNDPMLKKVKQNAEDKYKSKFIRIALSEKMFSGKCAYCESRITHDQNPPIEHFRPKSKYPELCFAWKNLLFACGKCNSTEFKGDRFPLEAEGGPPIDPTLEEPSVHLLFEYDAQTGLAIVGVKTIRGKTTRDLFGLNRNELMIARSEVLEKLAFIATKAAIGEPLAIKIMKDSCKSPSMYAAFARSIADRFGIDWQS